MEPIEFPQMNSKLLAGDIPNCDDLPVCKDGRRIVSIWRMSWREKLSALFFGTVFVSVLAPRTSPPIAVWVQHNRERIWETVRPK